MNEFDEEFNTDGTFSLALVAFLCLAIAGVLWWILGFLLLIKLLILFVLGMVLTLILS